MKAIVWTKYGSPDVLQLKEIEKPTPQADEALVKVHAATVTIGDCELRAMKGQPVFMLAFRLYLGLLKPTRITVLGQELAGEVEAVGRVVTQFKKGDQVYGPSLLRMGAYAEYKCLPEKYLTLKPASLAYEDAATLPTGGINGLHFLTAAKVQAGETVLINGAGGSIGTYAVQIAKAWGSIVTCVDSAEKLDMLRSIGADHVIDFRQADFTRNGATYDVIIDVIGNSPYSRSIKSLKPNGRYILGNPSLSARFRARRSSMSEGKTVRVELAPHKAE